MTTLDLSCTTMILLAIQDDGMVEARDSEVTQLNQLLVQEAGRFFHPLFTSRPRVRFAVP